MTDHREAAENLLDLVDDTLLSAAQATNRSPERTAELLQSLQLSATVALTHAVLDAGSAVREAAHYMHIFSTQYHGRSADVAADDPADGGE